MNINRYGRTYGNGILVTKFRVSYVKITSTQRNTERPHLDHMIDSSVPSCRDLHRSESVIPSELNTRSVVTLVAGIARN